MQRERVSKKICSYTISQNPFKDAGLNSHLNFRSQIVDLAAFRAVRRALKLNLSQISDGQFSAAFDESIFYTDCTGF